MQTALLYGPVLPDTIEACESTFNIFQTVHFSEDPSVNFFAGIPMDSGDFYPLSLLGASRQLFEPLAVDRYVVYSPRCAYYITDTEQVTFAVRLHTDKTKHIHFAVTAINKTKETVPFYLASYHYAILKFEETEAFWDRMNKFGFRLSENSSLLRTGRPLSPDQHPFRRWYSDRRILYSSKIRLFGI